LTQTEAHLKPDRLTKENKGEKYKKFIKPLYKAMQKEKVRYEVARIKAVSRHHLGINSGIKTGY
jgi:ribosomal protein S25